MFFVKVAGEIQKWHFCTHLVSLPLTVVLERMLASATRIVKPVAKVTRVPKGARRVNRSVKMQYTSTDLSPCVVKFMWRYNVEECAY